MNTVMSWGQDNHWRTALTQKIAWPRRRKCQILDMACGTGALSLHLLQEAQLQGIESVLSAVDPSASMLQKAQDRLEEWGVPGQVQLMEGSGEDIPLESESIHLYTCGFGLRNMKDRSKSLEEAYRVLHPGGQALYLEFSKETLPVLQPGYEAYLKTVVPALGRWFAQDEAAYQYLCDSILEFPQPEYILAELTDVGFHRVKRTGLFFGIVQIYEAYKPGPNTIRHQNLFQEVEL